MSERQIEIKVEPARSDHYDFMLTGGSIVANGRTFMYYCRHNAAPVQNGIDKGRIDLLEIIEDANPGERRKGSIILYSRGWPTKTDGTCDKARMPIGKDDVVMAVYGKILEMYN